jgi:hypothetical protein
MKQFEYQMTRRAIGRVEYARATAATADIARAQIVLSYGSQFDVADLYSDINAPHQILGEIDCSNFPMSEYAWLMREAKRTEALFTA